MITLYSKYYDLCPLSSKVKQAVKLSFNLQIIGIIYPKVLLTNDFKGKFMLEKNHKVFLLKHMYTQILLMKIKILKTFFFM